MLNKTDIINAADKSGDKGEIKQVEHWHDRHRRFKSSDKHLTEKCRTLT